MADENKYVWVLSRGDRCGGAGHSVYAVFATPPSEEVVTATPSFWEEGSPCRIKPWVEVGTADAPYRQWDGGLSWNSIEHNREYLLLEKHELR